MKAFRHYATKIASVVLVLAMLASMGVGLVSVSAATEVKVNPAAAAGTNGDVEIKADGNDRLAMRIKVNSAFSYYTVQLASYNSSFVAKAHVALYKWDFSYAKTVASTPVQEATVTINNNQWHKQTLSSNAPAGEYLIEVTGISTTYEKGVIAWFGNLGTNAISGGCVYKQGTPVTKDGNPTGEMRVSFGFTQSPATNFTAITGHPVEVPTYGETGTYNSSHYYRLAPVNDVVAQRLKVTAPIAGVRMWFPNWGNTSSVRISAYKWQGSYDATIASTPLSTQVYTSMGDHQSCSLYFKEAMPAGEYLFAAESLSPDQPTAIYYVASNDVAKGYTYIDGAEMRNALQMMVYFIGSKPSAPFADCTGYDDTSKGVATVPEKWELPEDSLINTHKVQPDTWVFTDGLGRESLQYGDEGVGEVNADKTLAMFYWNWHNAHNKSKATKVMNLQQFIEKYPEAKNLPSLTSTVQGKGDEAGQTLVPWNKSTSYAWNEPIYGHYSTDDEWVLRRHAELLANAGVDVVFTDNSNGIVPWEDGYDLLFQNWTRAQESGVNAPKISFYLPMYLQEAGNPGFGHWTTEQLEYLYMDIYQRGKYENLWFWFDGKPLMTAWQRELNTSDALQNEIKNFFNFRATVSSYDYNWSNGDVSSATKRVGYWGWASVYPQATMFASTADAQANKVEQMTVSVAQNYNYKSKSMTAMNGYYVTGRSYSSTNPGRVTNTETSFEPYSEHTKWGYNIGEQYAYALEVDPRVVFVTGWNEWTVVPGTLFKIQGVNFADQFNDEYSRDIEPTKGALKDHYYYQLINFSRQFQGATAMPRPGAEKTIYLDANLEDQWADVEPYFGAYIGNTMDRSEYGRATYYYYTDYSGRNDIIGAQVSRDGEYLYFNVECADNITPYTDKLWMNLYLDVNQGNQGWETFDYVINKSAASATTSVLERFTGNGYTSEVVGNVSYVVDGRYMTIVVPKAYLGITGTDYTVNFAWTDNVHDADDTGAKSGDKVIYSEFSGDIMDFYTSGDVAPGARFKYSYIVDDDYKLFEGQQVSNIATTFNETKFGQQFSTGINQQVDELSIRFSAPDDVDGDTIGTADGVLSIYQWKGNYDATVAAAPLYTTAFVARNMQYSTFDIPEGVDLTGDLYWEVTHTDNVNGKLAVLGATHKAAGVVNYIGGVQKACTGYAANGLKANTMDAKVKFKTVEYTYIYMNSITKEVLYSGNMPFSALPEQTRAELTAEANALADATGFRAFDGTFTLASDENNVYIYYTNHNFADSVKVNGIDVPMTENYVIVEAPETKDGVAFYGWKDKNGVYIANYTTFKFYPSSASDTLEAVYQDGSTLTAGVHTKIDRVDGQVTVTVTPIRDSSTKILEYGYFIKVGNPIEGHDTVVGNVVDSISGATKVVASQATSAFLQRTYNVQESTMYNDISVLAYVTYRAANGTVYTYYAEVDVAEGKIPDPTIDIVDPDIGLGGWL